MIVLRGICGNQPKSSYINIGSTLQKARVDGRLNKTYGFPVTEKIANHQRGLKWFTATRLFGLALTLSFKEMSAFGIACKCGERPILGRFADRQELERKLTPSG